MTRLAESVARVITRRSAGWTFRDSLAGLGFAVLIAVLWSAPSAALDNDRRVALVIGNSDYASAPALPNPANDALAMSDSLRKLGFTVKTGIDLDAAGMVSNLRSFGTMAETADVALVFYAGHGIQVDGENFLLPVDTTLERERDLNYEALALNLILSEVSQARKLGVVILDACRDNPFAGQLKTAMGPTRSTVVGRGLTRVDAPADTLVAFATRDGAVAEDGFGFNSPFTTALVSHLDEPGVEIGHYFRKVRDSVVQSTNGRQEPYVYGSLSAEQFYLNPRSSVPQPDLVQTSVPVPPARPAPQTDAEADLLFWRSIQDRDDATEYRAYLNRFPNGMFADIARYRLGSDEATEEPPAVEEPQEVTAAAPPPRRIWNRVRDYDLANDRGDDRDNDDDDGGDDGDD